MARVIFGFVCLAAFIGLTVSMNGCGGQTADTEDMLSAAGFQMKGAETPAQVQNLQNMPQGKLLQHTENGKPVFVYADAKGCKCMYVGDEAARQRYEKMAAEKKIADEQMMAAEEYEMDWGPWGPWRPY